MSDRSGVILQGVVGSTAYGLAREGSDIDQLGIYVADPLTVLGLDGPQTVTDSLVTHEPDLTLHEVAKYLSLALKCNPTVLELLYLDEYTVCEPFGNLLIKRRDAFLSASYVRNAYGGYANQQHHRLLGRQAEGKDGFSSDVKQRTAKHGRHCARLLLQGAQLLREGRIQVNVGEHRDYLFDMGQLAADDPDQFSRAVDVQLAEMDEIKTSLPEHPNRELVNETLVVIRLSGIRRHLGLRPVSLS